MAKKRGANKRFTPEQQQMFLQLLSLGMYSSIAAKKVGVSHSAICMKKKREPDFAEACDRAEAGFELSLIAKVVKSNDARIALQMLGVRFSKRWARPEIRHELNIGKPVDASERARILREQVEAAMDAAEGDENASLVRSVDPEETEE